MTGALGAFQTAVWGIVTFSILVVLHEMGHFLAARAFGVKVHEFMVGLPGPALRLKTKNMSWGVTAIPLGGYVRIAGMEPGAEDELIGQALVAVRDHDTVDPHSLSRVLGINEERAAALLATLEDWKALTRDGAGHASLSLVGDPAGLSADQIAALARSVTYRGQSTAKRIAILAMGVITNLTVAILTFTIVLSVWGYYQLTTRIDSVGPDTPAELADLRVGDVIVAVDGTAVGAWDEFQMVMARTEPGQVIELRLERDGSPLDLDIELADKEGHGYLGVGPTAVPVRPNVYESLGESLRLTGLVTRTILDLFDPARFSSTVKSFTGVVGVSVMAAEAAEAGPLSYASLIAMLSLSLGLMNVLPLPPLDGGKIALEVIERIAGRPLSRGFSLGVSAVGAVLLFSLIGYIMYVDIARLAG